jgi:hypothetical protein
MMKKKHLGEFMTDMFNKTPPPNTNLTKQTGYKFYMYTSMFYIEVLKNAFSSRATWSPIFETSKNSNFIASKKKPGCS